jgi:hypothetical protein
MDFKKGELVRCISKSKTTNWEAGKIQFQIGLLIEEKIEDIRMHGPWEKVKTPGWLVMTPDDGLVFRPTRNLIKISNLDRHLNYLLDVRTKLDELILKEEGRINA